MIRLMRRWLGMVLLLPALLLSVESAASVALFRCRLDRIARIACCCRDAARIDAAAAAAPAKTTIAARGCCDREEVHLVREAAPAPAQDPSSSLSLPWYGPIAVIPTPDGAPPHTTLRIAHIAPGRIGSLLLVKQSRLC